MLGLIQTHALCTPPSVSIDAVCSIFLLVFDAAHTMRALVCIGPLITAHDVMKLAVSAHGSAAGYINQLIALLRRTGNTNVQITCDTMSKLVAALRTSGVASTYASCSVLPHASS